MPDTLQTNQSLQRGESLVSSDGRKEFRFQDDSNLCVYHDRHCVWSTMTNGSGATRLSLQADGNIVLYDVMDRAVWDSHTNHHDGEQMRLVMQDDGNLVLYQGQYGTTFRWSTNTFQRRFRKVVFKNHCDMAVDCFPLVKSAETNDNIWSGRDNGGKTWVVQTDTIKTVDFVTDVDQNGQPLQDRLLDSNHMIHRWGQIAVKLGMDVMGGDDCWVSNISFVLDAQCQDVWVIEKTGSLRTGDANASTWPNNTPIPPNVVDPSDD